ncbi:MAG: potassium channel protein [Pyrinomonadaceae bacterium]|nr:potassium channel protein [Pyrinomonadaceae bacterium]
MSLTPPALRFARSSRVALGRALVALVVLIALGTIGFHLIEGWTILESLYMAVLTITTVGYGEVRPLSVRGRIFDIFFMLVGVSTAAYALSSMVQTFVRSELVSTLGERRRQREMNKLNDHFIICGAGRVGSRIIREMQRGDNLFVVIESNPQKVAAFDDEKAPVPILVRDATLESTLQEAGVERARGLAACLPDDADNLYVVLTARDLNPNLHIVARAIEEQAEPKLIRAGANRVVAPTIIGSHRMAQALMKPAVADFIDSIAAENLDLRFEEVELARASPYVNQTLRSTNIRSELDIVIVAIRRRGGEMIFNPAGEMMMLEGDLLVAIGRAEALARLSVLSKGAK